MIEAMACGTPVIGFKRGSVPEVVDEGVTGFITTTAGEMIHAVKHIQDLPRDACRALALQRFNINKIAKEYLNLC
jgi:glycosyltransferase involved in cell wall biosynthesis